MRVEQALGVQLGVSEGMRSKQQIGHTQHFLKRMYLEMIFCRFRNIWNRTGSFGGFDTFKWQRLQADLLCINTIDSLKGLQTKVTVTVLMEKTRVHPIVMCQSFAFQYWRREIWVVHWLSSKFISYSYDILSIFWKCRKIISKASAGHGTDGLFKYISTINDCIICTHVTFNLPKRYEH